MRYFVYSCFFFIYPLVCLSQSETSVWYFGENAGIKFNPDGSTTALTDGKLKTLEGCASISDSNGDILFYTDGITVYNKNHQVMLNGTGLSGHFSSTQSATIIQKPGSSNLFYIFTIDAVAKNNGLRYSEVDITLDGGLGGVTAGKNVPLYAPTCEKISVVKHVNNTDFWIITHGWQENKFYAHLVSSTGINPVPVVTGSGQFVGGSDASATQGYMKISPDGKKIVLCHQFLSSVELFDFDASNGMVNNPILFSKKDQPYGAEFSADSKVLYISLQIARAIYQYDLTAGDVASSEQLVFASPIFLGALQLGPNDKIYIANYYTPYLGVVNNPGILGIGCDVQSQGANLEGRNSTLGLPAFNQSFFNPSFKAEHLCLGSMTSFSLGSSPVVKSALWDFGDGSTSTDISPLHTYDSPGKYTVKVSAVSSFGTGLKTKEITISKIPMAYKPQDLLFCDDNNDGFYVFDLTSQNASILNGQNTGEFAVRYYSSGILILTPKEYINKAAYQSEIITAEVYNIGNNECKSSTDFTLHVFDMPLPALPANISDFTVCDNTSVGTDEDGKVIFDLTLQEPNILNGQPANQFVVSYYKDALMTQPINFPNIYQNTNSKEIIYVKVVNKENKVCDAQTSFKIEVLALPKISNVVNLKQCDDDIDGYSIFNLEEAINKITSNSIDEVITFHRTLADSENNINPILNRTTYRNTVVSADKLFVRVSNSQGCYRTAQLNLIVSTTQIPSSYSKTFIQCDDSNLNNQEGISNFDFSSVTKEIQDIFPSGQLLDITYYQNIEDALEEKNAITEISNYRNTNSPHLQKIFIRVDSRINNDCLGLGGYITLKVEPVPIIQSLERTHCDDDHDGIFAFDTSNIENEMLNGLNNVSVSYFDENNNQLSSPLPNPFLTSSQTVKVLVVNNTPAACSFTSAIKFTVDLLPQVYSLNSALSKVCDDEENPLIQDGKYAFDTSSFESILLGSQKGMIVKYYDAENNLLSSPLPNPFVTKSQNIRAEIINPKNLNCKADYVIPFIVNSVPRINLEGTELVCSNLPSFTKQINAGLINESEIEEYDYQWFFNGDKILNEKKYSLVVNKEGIYKVDVSDKYTHCVRTRIIKVSASDIASNVSIQVDESNKIVVSVSGRGDYLYAIDDPNGSYQSENVFLNVSAGIHTVYVKDQNGCGTVSQEVAVFGVPSFFTPNQDGYNDYWNVKGISADIKEKTTIKIFDRYGKLLKEMTPFSIGWDGNYLGSQMPSDDYWYVIELENGKVFKGHFSLKR